MSVKIGSARIDENGNAKGGKAGDQTGREVSTQSWYKHAKGWRVFRAKNPAVAEKIAQDMQWACDNRHIGYDQGQRLSLYDVAKPLGFNCKLVKTKCETDCSALVRVCCAYAGISLPNFRTPTEPAALLDSGAFVEMKGSKYTDTDKYLRRGDILVTRSQGHTVVVLTNGPKADVEPEPDPKLGDRTLRKGNTGSDVTELQKDLMQLGYSLPKYGADGDFGSETEKAVKAFQLAYGLTDDGVMNKGKDFDTLFKAIDGAKPTGQRVEITGHVNIRTAPGYDSKVIGTAHAGETYPYQGVTKEAEGKPWYLIEYEGDNGWVSGKYAKLVT